MGTITPIVCRAFVNSVVNRYDEADSQRDIFDRKAFPSLENLSETVEMAQLKRLRRIPALDLAADPAHLKNRSLEIRAFDLWILKAHVNRYWRGGPIYSESLSHSESSSLRIRSLDLVDLKVPKLQRAHSIISAKRDMGRENDRREASICAKGSIGRLFAFTNAFGPIGLKKSSLIQAAMTVRLEKLIKDGTIHQRDPLYDARPLQAFLGDYGDNNRLLSHMFATVFTAATPETKSAIVNQLHLFDAKLNTYSFWFERKVLNIQRTIVAYTPKVSDERYEAILHTFIAVAMGVGLYHVGTILRPRIVQFFVATAVPQAQNLLHKYGSITVIDLCEKTCKQAAVLVAHVVNSRVYYWLFGRFQGVIGQTAGFVVLGMIIPPVYVLKIIYFIRAPMVFIGVSTGRFVYDSYFSPAAQFQQRLVRSLATTPESPAKEKLLEEGLKAYQVWMYLMTEGAQQGLFKQVSL
jgi:hypothetical protein